MQSGFKTCSKCGEVKPLLLFSNDNGAKSGKASHCKVCKSKYAKPRIDTNKAKEWRRENRTKVKANYDKWNAEHPGRASALSREWRLRNPEKVKSIRAKRMGKVANNQKNGREDLQNWYVAKTISALMPERISISQIPPDLIEAKRAHLKLTRKLKELKE